MTAAEGSESGLQFVSWSVRFANPPTGERFFFGPKDFDVLRVGRCRARPRDRLRHLRLARHAAAAFPEVGERLRRQLRLVDHRAHGPHQPRDVPAPPQERRLDAEDAGAPARGEGDPGSLREAEDERSGATEDERRADESLSRARRQPGERLRADAADDAGAVRVLRDAVGGDRAARRAVHGLDQGPLRLRSAVHHARPDGHHAVRPDEDDAGDRRSDAAEDDALHAAHLHDDVHLGAERAGAVLDGEQSLGDRPAGRDEPPDWARRRHGSFGRRPSGA